MAIVGIDIGKKKFDIALLRDGKVLSKVFSNTAAGHAELLKWLSSKGIEKGDCSLCMEATSSYYEALALYLHTQGWTVSVVNPLQIKRFAESRLSRQKTDRADARVIAQFCDQHRPAPWQPPSAEVRELQRLVARLEAIQGMRVQEQNRLHEAHGVARESVQRMLQALDAELKALEKLIDEHIDRHPGLRAQCELLQTVPAVGPRLSSHFMAWVPLERMAEARAVAAFVGLSPRARESGTLRGKAQLCKLGHRRLRKLLYMPAMAALQYNPAAKALAARLRAAGKPGKLIIAAIMRKLVHWMFGVLKSARPFDPKLAVAKQ
jgi:transposase